MCAGEAPASVVNVRLPEWESDTRSRILTSAVEHYGNGGFGVGLRAIAADAGVTAAAVLKHFGSKEGLRKACDETVIATVSEYKSEAMTSPDFRGSALTAMASLDEYQPLVRYIIRCILDGGETARDFLTDMHAHALEWMRQGVESGHLRPSRDERLRVKLGFSISIGWMVQSVIMAGRPLADLDAAFWTSCTEEMMLPTLELYTQGMLTDTAVFDDYLAHLDATPGSGIDDR